MATTIDRAKAKLAAKIPGMPGEYNKSMRDFFGQDISASPPARAYAAKITPGVENTWEKNLKRAYGIG